MEQSKKLMSTAGILPKLRLGRKLPKGGVEPTGPHTVKMIGEKIVKGLDRDTGKEIDVMKYIVEENGEEKEYKVPVKDKQGNLHYLIQRLSEVPEGGEVTLEMKKAGPKNYIDTIHEYGGADDDLSDDDIESAMDSHEDHLSVGDENHEEETEDN